MIRTIFASLALLICVTNAPAQMTNSFPLWPDGAPGALGTNANDIPTLTFYPANTTNASGAAMIIAPGGGYGHLAGHEGKDYAVWLNDLGITCFVLKYRLGTSGYHHPAMLQDAARAMQTVRARASEWGIDPHRIGFMGSSAGGHLTATITTHFSAGDAAAADPIERVSSRPDLGILCYPVISLETPYAHGGSKTNLLGADPSPELVRQLSNENNVTSNTPPCFIWHTFEDKSVPVENSFLFAQALRKAGVPFDFHVYQHGGHGQGLGTRDGYDPSKFLPWTHDCAYWLKSQKFVK